MDERTAKNRLEATQQTVKFFETLLHATADGIIITGAGQNLIVANDAFSAVFGRQSREVIETNMYTWLEQLDDGAVQRWAEIEKKVSHEGICRNAEFNMTTTEGVRYLSVNASLLERIADEDRGVMISIWRDNTEIKQVEMALQQSERELNIRNQINNIFLTHPDEKMYEEVLNC